MKHRCQARWQERKKGKYHTFSELYLSKNLRRTKRYRFSCMFGRSYEIKQRPTASPTPTPWTSCLHYKCNLLASSSLYFVKQGCVQTPCLDILLSTHIPREQDLSNFQFSWWISPGLIIDQCYISFRFFSFIYLSTPTWSPSCGYRHQITKAWTPCNLNDW